MSMKSSHVITKNPCNVIGNTWQKLWKQWPLHLTWLNLFIPEFLKTVQCTINRITPSIRDHGKLSYYWKFGNEPTSWYKILIMLESLKMSIQIRLRMSFMINESRNMAIFTKILSFNLTSGPWKRAVTPSTSVPLAVATVTLGSIFASHDFWLQKKFTKWKWNLFFQITLNVLPNPIHFILSGLDLALIMTVKLTKYSILANIFDFSFGIPEISYTQT